MNIWILNHYAITPDLPGGTRHFDFGKELSKRGHKVTILASSFHYSLLKEIKSYDNNNYIIENINDNFKFVWVKTFPYKKNDWRRVLNMLSYSWRVYKTAKSLSLGKPNIIIGSSVHLFAVLTSYFLSRHFKTHFIMEARDLWPQTLIDMEISKWHPFVIFLSLLEKFLYKRAQKIIALMPKAHEYIESLGISPRKVAWIPNGVDLSRFNIKIEDVLSRSSNEFIMMYVGAFGRANNLDVAINSANILKDKYLNIKFVFIGDGPEKSRLIKRANLLKLRNIEFRDPIKKDKIPKVLAKTDILFFNLPNLPVFKYGISSNKLFDYLASGKPIIFSSNAMNNPIDEARVGITAPPDNPQALARAIIKVHNMPKEKKQEMGKRGREYVKKYHNIPILVNKLERVFEELLEKGE